MLLLCRYPSNVGMRLALETFLKHASTVCNTSEEYSCASCMPMTHSRTHCMLPAMVAPVDQWNRLS